MNVLSDVGLFLLKASHQITGPSEGIYLLLFLKMKVYSKIKIKEGMGCSLHTDMTEITERNNMKTKEKQASFT